jgi:hypothetical protein
VVEIPPDRPAFNPLWLEIPVDDAFWRVWKMNSLQMRRDGYVLRKSDGKWRAFLSKPPESRRRMR